MDDFKSSSNNDVTYNGITILESNFTNFFETMDDMFIVSDLNGMIIHCNKSLIDKLGFSILELKNMNIIDLHPINIRKKASQIVEKMLNKEIQSCPLDVESKYGETFSVETRVSFGKWDNKDCLLSISRDFTQENENFQLFSKIFESNPLPIFITSIYDNRIININPAFSKKIGYLESEVIGKTLEELNIFSDFNEFENIKNNRLSKKTIKDEELSLNSKNGKILSGIFSFEVISIKSIESLLTVMLDITDRVEIVNILEDKYQKLNNIIEGTNLGTWEWNVRTGELKVNNQWANMIGYQLKEIENKEVEIWEKHTHPDDLRYSNSMLKKHLNAETEYYESQVRMTHKNGNIVWIQDRGKVILRDENGIAMKMFGTHSDITKMKEAEENLIESEKRFLLALDQTKAGLWDYDMLTNKVFYSAMWKKILGYQEDEVENSFEGWRKLWNKDESSYIEKTIDDYLSGKTSNYEVIHRLKHKDGSWRWILTRGGVLKNDLGIPYRWIGTNIDITKDREQSEELERFFSVNLDLLCIADLQGNFIKTNKAWEDILGYSTQELNKRKFLDFVHPDDMDKTLETMKQLDDGQKVLQFTNRYITINGDYRYIEWRSNPYEGVIYAAARDITERIEYEKKILELSNRDTLTNAYNRRYVYERAQEIIEIYNRTGQLFSVCILDIDHFKNINDDYGHQIGDCVLKEFTKIIDNNLRPYDILGRYGGEEFIVVLTNTDIEDSILVIERILNIIRKKEFNFEGNKISFTFSAGISNCKEILKEQIIIDNLIELADKRMYQAKNAGRNKIIASS